MRRIILLAATMALTLLMASGVALAVTKIGTNGPDTLSGTNGSDTLFGKGGNDTLFSRAGNDTLLGGPGKDRLVGGEKVGRAYRTQGGQKNLLGGDGNDMIIGGRGADNIVGGEGNDFLATSDLITNTADDKVFGGDGTDVINALSAPEAKALIFCGDGRDVVIVNRKDVVAADCEKVFVGLGSIDAWFEAIPEGFFEGLPPFFVFPE
jgi:Ca2+-binding RTX toxin-like protein